MIRTFLNPSNSFFLTHNIVTNTGIYPFMQIAVKFYYRSDHLNMIL